MLARHGLYHLGMARKVPPTRSEAGTPGLCPFAHARPGGPVPDGGESARNAELAALMASTLDPMVTIDSLGTILSASNSIERVFGWKPSEVIGRNVNILMPEPHRSGHDQYLANYRKTLKTNILGRTREFEAVRRDGTRFPIDLSIARADVPGQKLPLFVGVIRDISERKAVERELEQHRNHLEDMVRERTRELDHSHEQLRLADRLAAIGALAAGLGHDMNNVLLPVRARMNALDALNLPEQASEHLASIRKSCTYLQQLTDGLHMLALNPDEGEAGVAITDLYEWWSTVGTLLSKAVPKGVRFKSNIARDVPLVAVAPHRLTQAMLNLIVNAGEAIQSMPMRRGVGEVRAWAHAAADGRHVYLGVTDNGPGMTPEVKARAFDAFFTTKKRSLGTGLGLSLVRNIALSAGGEIGVDTAPGKGTEIVLTLPLAQEHHPPGTDNQIARRATVYILDRGPSSMAAHILEAAGWAVTRSAEPVPGDAVVWVTEPCERALAAATAFLKRGDGGGRAVVAVGTPPAREAWEKLGAFIVENPRDFDSLRDGLGRAIRAATASTTGAGAAPTDAKPPSTPAKDSHAKSKARPAKSTPARSRVKKGPAR